jgi:hypothetical protein
MEAVHMSRTREEIESDLYHRSVRPDVPRAVVQAHASQRQVLEDCIRETQEHYGCTPGVAMRLIESQVVAYERAMGSRRAVPETDGTDGEPPKPWTLALARRASGRQ